MKKSTVVLLLASFIFLIFIVVGLFVAMMVVVMQGGSPNLLGASRLALIRVEGLIYDAEEWIDQVEEYQEDDSIRGIVVRIDSPGGAVDPSQELYNALVEAQEQYGKVVVASFGSLAASGGYYVACNADRIVSSAGSLTGSIGVYSKFPVAKELMEKIGISYETVKAGEYKDFGAMDRGLSEKERQMMQAVIDDTYDQFVEAVLKGRQKSFKKLLETWEAKPPFEYPFTPDAVEIIQTYQRKRKQFAAQDAPSLNAASLANATADETIENASEADSHLPAPNSEMLFAFAKSIAEGKIYTGRQALKIGLVDQLGSLDDAIHLAAKLAGIRGEPTVIERKKREYGLLDFLTQGLASLTAKQVHSPIQYRFPY